jgi:phosphate transport system protein
VVESDSELARRVHQEDELVDALHKQTFHLLEARMREQPESIPAQIQLLSVSRHLERIADLATNIAEDVIFMVEGELVRHQTW